jgi:hypothetical protein
MKIPYRGKRELEELNKSRTGTCEALHSALLVIENVI